MKNKPPTVAQAARNIKAMARRISGSEERNADAEARRLAMLVDAFPGSNVQPLTYGKGDALRLPNGKLHTVAQSIRGFQNYVYKREDGRFCLRRVPTSSRFGHPVAVLSARDTPDEEMRAALMPTDADPLPATRDEILRFALEEIAGMEVSIPVADVLQRMREALDHG